MISSIPFHRILALSGALFAASLPSRAQTSTAATPGALRAYSTFHSLGFEWDLTGDTNHNATASVRYRKAGAADWKEALFLLRVDWLGSYSLDRATQLPQQTGDRRYDMLAGSVMFLQPGTSYEVELTLRDPENRAPLTRVQTIATRAAPRLRADARRIYVRPDARGGNGTAAQPFGRLADAQQRARPGDIVVLGAGDYGTATLDKAGQAQSYIAYVAAPGARATFRQINVNADYLWLDGLSLRATENDKGGVKSNATASHVVVRGCDFEGLSYSVTLSWQGKNTQWTIVDNTIVGAKDTGELSATGEEGAFSGEGVELNKSGGGHVVAYNRISRVADGISYTHTNCDIFGNDFFDTSDDGIEMDYGYANNRAWENRISNFHYHGISFQPANSGPWYFVRNHIVSPRGSALKFRATHRFVLVGNTLAAPRFGADFMHHIYNAYARNNLFVGLADTGPAWSAQVRYTAKAAAKNTVIPDQWVPDWKTDVDYNGFAVADPRQGFRFRNGELLDLVGLQERAGIERHSRVIDRATLLANYPKLSHPAGAPYALLMPAGGARDGGVRVPNLADDFAGAAPDLGAIEAGRPMPKYGPRSGYVLGQPLF